MAFRNYRVVARLPYTTGIPEDVSTNVWHFHVDDTAAGGPVGNATALLAEFYVTVQAGATNAIGEYYSSLVTRAADACTLTVYDEADPEPRTPVGVRTFTLPAAAVADSLPTEVALCLSWKGFPGSGVSPESQRNRVYLGPLNSATLDLSGDDGRPSSLFLADLAVALGGLFDDDSGGAIEWIGWSPSANSNFTIAEAWVDNEFDTQRRRGRRATSRTTVPNPSP